jgi:hypothetical protein
MSVRGVESVAPGISFMAHWLGRRRCGELQGYGMFVCLAAAAYFHSTIIAGISLFVVLPPCFGG